MFGGGGETKQDPAVGRLLAQVQAESGARKKVQAELAEAQSKIVALQTEVEVAHQRLAAARKGQKASRERAARFKAALEKARGQ